MSTTQFVEICHPSIPSTAMTPALVPLQAVDEWYAKGWLLVDPEAPPPVTDTPYYTKEALLSQIQGGAAPIGTALRAASDAARIVPQLTAYEAQTDLTKTVLFQDGDTVYAAGPGSTYTLYKSTDRGQMWTAKGNLSADTRNLTRIGTTGTLIAVTAAGAIKRSADDGTTWTTVQTVPFAPLTPPIDTPSGYVMFGEYGGANNTAYNIWRSTDDGLTFTSALASPPNATDARHWHGIYYDDVEGCFVATHDRNSGPAHYRSSDQGATWTLIGDATQPEHPNWVAPMFFADYIAWGYDNERNGVIARIPRADFYAGRFDLVEDVAQLNRKVFYGVFPIRPDVWMVAQATETILGVVPEGPSSYAQEVHIVSDNGARVTGGLEHTTPGAKMGTLQGSKMTFPAWPYAKRDQRGESWMNVHAGLMPGTTSALPYSVGWNPPIKSTTPAAGVTAPYLRAGELFYAKANDGTIVPIIDYDGTNKRLRLYNSLAAALPEIRFYEYDQISFLFSGVTKVAIGTDNLNLNGIELRLNGNTGAKVLRGAGVPEGVKAAPAGSMYLNESGGAGQTLWIKESGTGNTGWVAK